MSKLADLKAYMSTHCISSSVAESVLGIAFDRVTDDQADEAKDNLSVLVSKRDFDEAWFADLARSHGFTEESIAIAASVEALPGVLSIFDPFSF